MPGQVNPDQVNPDQAVEAFVRYIQSAYDPNNPDEQWLVEIQRVLRGLAIAYETLSPLDGSDRSNLWHEYFSKGLDTFLHTLPGNSNETIRRANELLDRYSAGDGVPPPGTNARFIGTLYSTIAGGSRSNGPAAQHGNHDEVPEVPEVPVAAPAAAEARASQPREIMQIEQEGGLVYALGPGEQMFVQYTDLKGNTPSVNEYVYKGPAVVKFMKGDGSKRLPAAAAGTAAAGTAEDPVEL
ncbi:hypothetical protein B0T20DRAFT_397823 [Sordaria brevicollis]|uniref:Uncharacterized protein n=1 Tax=Sordaria brevicollis TaxID=83679 RepID=A0AAE0NVD6_SORBR|nr:hypothetical protein B0T20DRAFT_397823 [Sordaria brevicollis]